MIGLMQAIGLFAGLLSVIAFFPYIRDVIKGKTKPERASWLIWLVLGSIAFSSQLAKGASDSLWMTAAQTFGVILVFILSLKYGVGGLNGRDSISLAVAALGILLWFITSEAAVALYIVIFIDAIGAWLTVLKTYKDPGSETLISWVLYGTSGILAMISVGSFNLILLAYPFYIVLANYAVVFAIIFGRKKK